MEETKDGIIPLNKPKGMSSHDCVNRIRKMLHIKRVGHTGTLDPTVSGVLPICINRATKVAEYMSAYNKTYEAVVSLGSSTTTEDHTGEVLEQRKPKEVKTDDVIPVLEQLTGDIEQVPPMYSAVKVNGKKLYEYAREGKTIDRPARTVRIFSMELTQPPKREENGNVTFSVRIHCSKGTYIRTLAVAIGDALGVPAHMASLVRTQAGPFSLEESITFQELQKAQDEGKIAKYLLPIKQAVSILPSVTVSEEVELQILDGAVIKGTKDLSNLRTAVYNERGECLAIYVPHPKQPGWVKPEKVLKIKNRT